MFVGLFQPFWLLIHGVAYNLPQSELQKTELVDFYNFLTVLFQILPCPFCSHHAIAYFYVNSYDLSQCKKGQDVFKWTVAFHNDVNHRTNKREFTLEEATVAIRAHMSGQSKAQYANEALLTLAYQSFETLQTNLLILKNESHKIQGKALVTIQDPPDASQANIEYVFDSVFFIATEMVSAKIFNVDQSKQFVQLILSITKLAPSELFRHESSKFLQENPLPISFETSDTMMQFIVDWYNAVGGVTYKHTRPIVESEIKQRLQSTLERWRKYDHDQTSYTKQRLKLSEEYKHVFEERQLIDAGKSKAKTSNTTALIITVVVLIAFVLLLVLFMARYQPS